MNCKSILILSLTVPSLCVATTPVPYGAEEAILGRILAVVRSQSSAGPVALDLLERVAMGQASEINPESEKQVGLNPADLKQKGFQAVVVREVAIWYIGATGLPKAIEFLSNLKIADFPDDPSLGIWAQAQVAIRNASFVRITDPEEKIEFLRSVLTERNYATAHSGTASWAVEELCNSGASAALPEIQESIRRVGNGQRDQDDIQFCKDRMQVVSSHPDRAKALGSALNLDGQPQDGRLVGWAVFQLTMMHSAGADGELAHFAAAMDKLPMDSPIRQRLGVYRAGIRSVPVSGPR
jgi:hypothetical protein